MLWCYYGWANSFTRRKHPERGGGGGGEGEKKGKLTRRRWDQHYRPGSRSWRRTAGRWGWAGLACDCRPFDPWWRRLPGRCRWNGAHLPRSWWRCRRTDPPSRSYLNEFIESVSLHWLRIHRPSRISVSCLVASVSFGFPYIPMNTLLLIWSSINQIIRKYYSFKMTTRRWVIHFLSQIPYR